MKNELVVAAGAVPVTMFLLASIGGNTATMSPGDSRAVREGIGIASFAMLMAAASTGSVPATIATALAVGASLWAMREVWQIPSLSEAIPS